MRIIRAAEADSVLARRSSRMAEAEEVVKPIIENVRKRGDAALIDYARRFDGLESSCYLVPGHELAQAESQVSSEFRSAIIQAAANIEKFARLQMPAEFKKQLTVGHTVGQIVRPLESVAAYIPGGRYPLPSTVLMTCVPAIAAGVPNLWITTPKAVYETYAAASMLGVRNVARLGGAHAIAGFAFGTDTLPKVDRIVGPGNIYVAAAKKLLSGEVGIDFVAGPTEVLIIANEGNPVWIAADMIAQAEHDVDASALLLTTSRSLAEVVALEIEKQLLPGCAQQSLQTNGAIIVCESDAQCIALSNQIAPEHLVLHEPELLLLVQNAGSVFLGPFSPEAAGDYATGPNHVLPTAGAARVRGGLSVMDFVKVITVQELDKDALANVARAATTIARAEGLEGHARSIEVRLET